MINADKIVAQFIELLEQNEYFADKKIVSAFTRSIKPTVMKRVYIACGMLELNADNVALGEEVKAGSVKLFADIYVPWKITDFDIQQAVCKIVKSAEDFCISSVYASEQYQDSDTQCIVQRVVLTISDIMTFDS